MGLMFSDESKAIIEALLFVSKEPITIKSLSQITEIAEADIRLLMDELIEEYSRIKHGINIRLVANGYQMCTRSELSPYIERLYKPQNSYGLSKAALETLAIIAYRQPITRAEIEIIRGVKAESSIGTLLEKNLVKEMGRKDTPGRPMLFGTSDSFLKYFGLENLSQLPEPDVFTVTLTAGELKEAGEGNEREEVEDEDEQNTSVEEAGKEDQTESGEQIEDLLE